MNLVIDVGNTRIKIAVFKNSEIIHNDVFTYDNFIVGLFKCIEKYKCENAIISSVKTLKKSEINKISTKIKLLQLDFSIKVPFLNKYSTPKTLGVDRIALVANAVSVFKGKNVLIIDAGTCITYDFVNSKGEYFGGAISPGIEMRYKSMHHFTSKLPLLSLDINYEKLIGDSTESSMHSGVIFGVVGEIDSAINEYKLKNEDLTVVLTGGDVNFLANKLKNGIFANSNFLLEGLNSILTYNLE